MPSVIVLFYKYRWLFCRTKPRNILYSTSLTLQDTLLYTLPPLRGFPVGVRTTLDALRHAGVKQVVLDERRRLSASNRAINTNIQLDQHLSPSPSTSV
jgi:hypothetical protein